MARSIAHLAKSLKTNQLTVQPALSGITKRTCEYTFLYIVLLLVFLLLLLVVIGYFVFIHSRHCWLENDVRAPTGESLSSVSVIVECRAWHRCVDNTYVIWMMKLYSMVYIYAQCTQTRMYMEPERRAKSLFTVWFGNFGRKKTHFNLLRRRWNIVSWSGRLQALSDYPNIHFCCHWNCFDLWWKRIKRASTRYFWTLYRTYCVHSESEQSGEDERYSIHSNRIHVRAHDYPFSKERTKDKIKILHFILAATCSIDRFIYSIAFSFN